MKRMEKIIWSLVVIALFVLGAASLMVGAAFMDADDSTSAMSTETTETTEVTEEATVPTEEVKAPESSASSNSKPTETIKPTKSTAPVAVEYDEAFIEKWSDSAIYIAKTVWGEARGVSAYEQEKVIWCILNRVDDSRFPNTIIGVITAPNQFHGYSSGFPCTDEMYKLALDVIYRWQLEKAGGESNRNLGPEYVYFSADGTGLGNVFRTHW